MMSLAICINCGYAKTAPIQKCPNCGSIPRTDAEKAKSLILSLNYEIDDVYKGKTREDLLKIGTLIASSQYRYDEAEVDAVIRNAHDILSVPQSVLIKSGIRWLFWPIIIFMIMVIIIVHHYF